MGVGGWAMVESWTVEGTNAAGLSGSSRGQTEGSEKPVEVSIPDSAPEDSRDPVAAGDSCRDAFDGLLEPGRVGRRDEVGVGWAPVWVWERAGVESALVLFQSVSKG